ncbi:MAG: long-chain fatty acid--CoA ligase, partial [Candidatus Omnitrophica bacterium]|nr:long-chain fatty acid--CoA ligase [Candidatus Omnitrophota bacterium]
MIPHNLGELLSFTAQTYPRRTAIVFGQKKIDYKTLDETTSRIARGIRNLGIKKGDRIALLLDNCPEFVIGYFSILKAGGVVVPINYMFKKEEARFILEDSQASALITSRIYVPMAEELRLRVDSLQKVITTLKTNEELPNLNSLAAATLDPSEKYATVDPSDLGVILYTSGTTGHPKGAMLSHYNLISNAIDSANAIRGNHRYTFICVLPLFHSFAATVCMNLPLYVGGTMVIMKSVRPFKRIIRAIRKNNVTVFAGIPSLFTILKDMKLPRFFRSQLITLFNPVKICISGAAALPVETFQGFEKKFRIPLLEGYGLTEATPVVTLNPLKGKRKPGSIGQVLSKNISVRIVDSNGNNISCGEVGELLVKGPNVMQGYFRQPEATAETIKDGWLYTGDMARIDNEGYIFIVGRKKEMVNVRGLNVYPREIEEVLYQNIKIKEAAVVGVADPHKGEVPLGFVVLHEGQTATAHELIQYLREHLAPYKIPKHIEFRS